MNPDPYNGLFGGSNCRDSPVQTQRACNCQAGTCNASEAYLNQFDELFKYTLPKGGKLAAFFAESIQVGRVWNICASMAVGFYTSFWYINFPLSDLKKAIWLSNLTCKFRKKIPGLSTILAMDLWSLIAV